MLESKYLKIFNHIDLFLIPKSSNLMFYNRLFGFVTITVLIVKFYIKIKNRIYDEILIHFIMIEFNKID